MAHNGATVALAALGVGLVLLRRQGRQPSQTSPRRHLRHGESSGLPIAVIEVQSAAQDAVVGPPVATAAPVATPSPTEQPRVVIGTPLDGATADPGWLDRLGQIASGWFLVGGNQLPNSRPADETVWSPGGISYGSL